jgi:hypothetical protein
LKCYPDYRRLDLRRCRLLRTALANGEGLVVRFFPKTIDSWVGNFLGGSTKFNFIVFHSNERDVIVVAKGEAFIVDPESRTVRDRFGYDIEAVIPLAAQGSLIFQGRTDFRAVRADNSSWRSPRISWDGFRAIQIHGSKLKGEAWTPIGDKWMPFDLDLITGYCPNPAYNAQNCRAD